MFFFFIDLDGLGVGEQPIYVYCNMTDGIIDYFILFLFSIVGTS